MSGTTDVFLSYNSADRKQVQILVDNLKKRDVKVWFDLYEIQPGDEWQSQLARALDQADVVLVVTGKHGFGPWHEVEAERAVAAAVADTERRVIPVLLPDSPPAEELKGFLKRYQPVRFESLDDESALEELLRALREPEKVDIFIERDPGHALDRLHYIVEPGKDKLSSRGSSHVICNLECTDRWTGSPARIVDVETAINKSTRVVITSPPGSGRRTLALEVALKIRDDQQSKRVPEPFMAFVWLSIGPVCRGLRDVLDSIAKTLKYDYVTHLKDDDKRRELRRILKAAPTMLIVTDVDLADENVRAYLEDDLPQTVHLMATAREPQSIDGAYNVPLTPYSQPELIQMAKELRRKFGMPDELCPTLPELETIARLSGGLPLALRIELGLLWDGLKFNELKRLLGLSNSDGPLSTAFEISLDRLNADEVRILRAVGVFPDGCTVSAASILSKVHDEMSVTSSLARLCRIGLLRRDGERHRIHPAVLALISNRFEEDQVAFEKNYVEYYAEFVNKHSGSDRRGGLGPLAAERLNIREAMRLCRILCSDTVFHKFHLATYHMLWAEGYWNENTENSLYYLRSTRGSSSDEAWVRMECLGWIYHCRGEYENAEEQYLLAEEALNRTQEFEPLVKARLLNYQGRLAAARDQFDQATDLLWKGLRYAEDPLTCSYLESALGDVYFAQGDYTSASRHYNTVELLSSDEDRFRRCSVICDHADVAMATGCFDDAANGYQNAHRIAHDVGRLEVLARCTFGLGRVSFVRNEKGKARKYLRQAEEQFDRLGRERDTARCRRLLDAIKANRVIIGEPLHPPVPPNGIEVVLINSPRALTPYPDGRFQDPRMPLGLIYLSTYIKKRGVGTLLIDAEGEGMGVSQVIAMIIKKQPKVVGLNCHTHNRWTVYEIARTIRAVMGDQLLIVLGGSHPTADPEGTLEEFAVKNKKESEPKKEHDTMNVVVIRGEGERALYELVRRSLSPSDVPSVHEFKTRRQSTKFMPRFRNLDSLGIPNLDGIPIDKYLSFEISDLKEGMWKRAYISASRGCRYACKFCAECPSWKTKQSFRSPSSVIEEMDALKKRTTRFYFYDDMLTDWPKLDEFCTLSNARGYHWSCSTRIDVVNDELLTKMAWGGCREIAFGLESGSEKLLKEMCKGWQRVLNTWAEVGEKIKLCVDKGIRPRTHFMVGFPNEKKEDFEKTAEFAIYLRDEYQLPDANFFVVKVYPATGLCNMLNRLRSERSLTPAQTYNTKSVHDWDRVIDRRVVAKLSRFNDIPVVSVNDDYSSTALRRIARNACELFFDESACRADISTSLWIGVE